MSSGPTLWQLIVDTIRERGPLTAADFMALALYAPGLGYYARAPRRTGRSGDFYTSVDVGPTYGTLLAVQIAEIWEVMGRPPSFDLVEAGAGDGQLAHDVLDHLARSERSLYTAIDLHLVEVSQAARAAHEQTLGRHAVKLVTSGVALPAQFAGALYANELLDALPTHVVVMTPTGLREVHVGLENESLVEVVATPSTPELEQYLDGVGARLDVGWRAEVNLEAKAWMRSAVERLATGAAIVVDYGHEAHDLYSASHATGTLSSFRRHTSGGAAPTAEWLAEPGERDITAHVDFTSLRMAAEAAGGKTLALLDQTYFLLGLGAMDRIADAVGTGIDAIRRRLATRTLLMPGGLGSTHKVLVVGKGIGEPSLRCASMGARLS